MQYYGGLLGTVAEIWFFTHKDVSYGKKIGAIIGFWIVISILMALLGFIGYAVGAKVVIGLCAILEVMFILTGILWWTVAYKVKLDVEAEKQHL